MLLRLLVEISKQQKENIDLTKAIELMTRKNIALFKTINDKDSFKSDLGNS